MSRIIGKGRYATETYPETPRGGGTPSGSSLIPIHYQFWVGVLDVPPITPNGSIQSPFPTLQEALTAGAALPLGVIIDYFLADADYTGEGPVAIPSGKTSRLISMCGGTQVGPITVASEDPSTVLTLSDVLDPTGVAVTGAVGGNVLLELFYAEPEGNGIGALVETLPAGQLQIKATNGAIASISSPKCNLIQSSGTNYPGIINTPTCDLRTSDADIKNNVTVFTYGCVDCVIGRPENGSQWTVGAVAPVPLGFNSCAFAGSGDFNGPVGSFTTDIDSGYAAQVAGWTLSGGATTVFTVRGDVGKVLTINPTGFPQLLPPSGLGYGLYAARPAPGTAGARYVASDGSIEWVDSGTVWKPLIAGTPGTQIPALASFPNAYGGATWADQAGTISGISPGTGVDNLVARTGAAPVGAFTLTVHLSGDMGSPNNGGGPGLVLGDGTHFIWFGVVLGIANPPFLVTQDWPAIGAPGAFGNPGVPGPDLGQWVRVRSDGVGTLTFEASTNGLAWVCYGTLADFGITEIGIGIRDNAPNVAVFDSWAVS